MIYIPVVLWIAVLSILIAVACLIAAVVPQWFFVSPASITFGLQRACVGQTCDTTQWNNYQICQSTSEWKNRELVVAIFLWISLVLDIIAVVILALALLRKHLLEGRGKMIGLVVLQLATAAIAFIALMIYSGTMKSWINCNDSICKSFPTASQCDYGASFIIFAFVFILHFFVAVLYVVRWMNWLVNFSRTIEWLAMFFLVVAAAFTIGAGVTTRWTVIAQAQNSYLGMFQGCINGRSCDSLSNVFASPIVYSASCSHSRGELIDRSNSVGALLIIAFIAMLVVGIVHILRQLQVIRDPFTTMVRIIFTVVVGVAGALAFIAHFIFAGTYNSWLYCGDNFCDANQSSSCNYGVSLAAGLIALILFVFLVCVMLLDLIGCASSCLTFTEPGAAHANSPYGSKTRVVHETSTTTVTTSSTRRDNGKDDWAYQSDSHYYYSRSRNLYWDKASNMYYDPDQPHKDWFRA